MKIAIGDLLLAKRENRKISQFKADAPSAEMTLESINLAEQMAYAGTGSLPIEGAAAEVAEIITKRSELPVIGCGSGPGSDEQVLISPDILGLTQGPGPKFAKSYGKLADATINAFNAYSRQIKSGKISRPDKGHSYHMKSGEHDRLQGLLKGRS